MRYILKYIPIVVLAAFFTACSKTSRDGGGDSLVRVGNSILTIGDLRGQIPVGTSPADSVRIARAYIRSWIDGKLIGEIASRNIGDLTEIDRMVEDYRNELIAYEYRRRMYDSHAPVISEDSVRAVYNSDPSRFKLQTPMVKGVYLKMPDNASGLKLARRYYRSTETKDIDQLEKQCLDKAVSYDYFRDRWVDWEQIESRIPMEFGASPDNFLKTSKSIDFSQGGYTYLLDISEYLPSGEIMPYEVARDQIVRELIYRDQVRYDRELRLELLREANEKGDVEIFCDLDS